MAIPGVEAQGIRLKVNPRSSRKFLAPLGPPKPSGDGGYALSFRAFRDIAFR